MDYFKKIEENPYKDLAWNIPERKQGVVSVLGGNSQNFRTVVKVAEFLQSKYPVQKVNVVLPDFLRGKIPMLPDFTFLSSTDSGSFADTEELEKSINGADYSLLVGDFSKNSITGKAVAGACADSEKPLLITRDTVDLIAENTADGVLMNEQVTVFCSLIQLQKILRAVYYPKMLLMSQSLVQVAEVLHKFTLSYPVSLVTLHSGQVLVAKNGQVMAVPLETTGYSAITFWSGEASAKILAMNLYNPHNFMQATVSAVMALD